MVISKTRFSYFRYSYCCFMCCNVLDQFISKHLMDQNSLFGTIFQNYGLFPPTIVLIISMIIFNYYVFKTFKNRLAQAIILIVSFVYTLIKTNAWVSETVQYMMSTSENIKNINLWVWQITKETLVKLYQLA